MKSYSVTLTTFLFLYLGAAVSGFTVSPSPSHTSKAMLQMQSLPSSGEITKVIATAFLAATIATSAATPALAISSSTDLFGSTELILAGRSGGRAGGRAGGGGFARSSYRAPPATYRSSTTIIRPMITPPSVVISPFGGGFGYGYNPLGGVGLGYGLGTMNNFSNEMRDYRQESEIQREKAELELAKEKNAELEARIKALEQTGKPLQVDE